MKTPYEPFKIFRLIESGSKEELEEHLKCEPESVHELSRNGDTVLFAALAVESEEVLWICETLLSHGANVHSKGHRKENLLHEAAFNGQEKCIELFLSKGLGGRVNEKDKEGSTPADYAVQEGHLGILKAFHAAGADLQCQDRRGLNLLHTAIICSLENKFEEMILWLIEQGVSLKQKDKEGRVPADYIRSKVKLGKWLKGVEQAMMEREALAEVLTVSKPPPIRATMAPELISPASLNDSSTQVSQACTMDPKSAETHVNQGDADATSHGKRNRL